MVHRDPCLAVPGVLQCKKKPVAAAEAPSLMAGHSRAESGWEEVAAGVAVCGALLVLPTDQLLLNCCVSLWPQRAQGYWNHTAGFSGGLLSGMKRKMQRCETENCITGRGVITHCYWRRSVVSGITCRQHASHAEPGKWTEWRPLSVYCV